MPSVGENFPAVEDVLRIEHALDLAQDPEQVVAELIVHVLGARDADAVLGGERPFELSHQCGGLIGNLPEFFQVARGMQIENRAHVKQSAGGVPVVTRLQAERFHNRLQSAHVFR